MIDSCGFTSGLLALGVAEEVVGARSS
jgi:hypothetical protein